MGRRRVWSGLLLATIGGGCAVGPNYHTPETKTPDGWSTTQPAVATSQPAQLATWWQTLHDPLLDSLMERAVASNLDLRIATARVREARAQRDVASAAFWPTINLGGSYNYSGSSENVGSGASAKPRRFGLPSVSLSEGTVGTGPHVTISPQRIGPLSPGGSRAPTVSLAPGSFSVPGGLGPAGLTLSPPTRTPAVSRQQNLFQAGFDATWELDVFGGTRRAVEATDADLAAFEEGRRGVLVSLISEVALDYVQLRGFQRRLAIADENIVAQTDILRLTRIKSQGGFGNDLDIAQAQAQLATTQAQVPLLQTGIRQTIYQLSALLGQPPDALIAELESVAPLPATPPDVPTGLPSELLRRRPDVRQAERQLAAATARIGEAMADLFPKFSLTGSFGPTASDARHLLDSRSLGWSLGPAVNWPIWEGGAIRANIEVQNARQEQALATYEQTVLTAFADVESALVAYSSEKVRHESLAVAVASNQRSTELSKELYSRGGLTPFLNVLISEQALYASQDQLVQSETTTVENLIALYKALGGGWEVPAD